MRNAWIVMGYLCLFNCRHDDGPFLPSRAPHVHFSDTVEGVFQPTVRFPFAEPTSIQLQLCSQTLSSQLLSLLVHRF